jgi:GMP synthase-like glutamine amidotransferase
MAIVILEHSADCPADLLIDSLRSFGQRLRVVQLHAGHPVPADLDDVHGLVSLGGPQTVHLNDAPWMKAEMDLLRQAHVGGVPVLGLCLGAQLLAAALGGETGRMPAPERGWTRVQLSPVGREEPMLAGQPWSGHWFSWHQDQVLRLPDGATPLASSDLCKVQAYRVGIRSYGFQFHPEWSADTIRREIAGGAAEVQACGGSLEGMLADTDRLAPSAERLARRLFESVSVLLMPADRLNKGIAKALHH